MITTLIVLFLFCTLIQLCYHFGLFKKHKTDNDLVVVSISDIPEITILICAKNEAVNLQENLPQILDQQYPKNKFTVFVVNDNSDDNTIDILNNLQKNYSNLKYINISHNQQRVFGGKKFALHIGMQQVNTPLVLLTDADCTPASSKWLQLMCAKSVANNNAVILGYGAYQCKSNWLNKFIRFETVHTYKQYACMAAANKAYMGVGRNLMYPVMHYFEAMNDNDFVEKYRATISGDDDVLINFFAKKHKTIIAYGNSLAHTISTVPKDFSSWLHQKQRHLSTGKLYTASTKLILGLYAVTQACFWFLGLGLIIILLSKIINTQNILYENAWFSNSKILFIIVIASMIMRNFLYYKSFVRYAKVLNEKKLKNWFLLLDVFWAIYNVILSPFIFFKSKQQWK